MVKVNTETDGVTKEKTFIAYTDKTGFFKLMIPDKFSNLKCSLTVSEFHFTYQEITLEIKKQNDPLKVFLKNRSSHISGKIIPRRQ